MTKELPQSKQVFGLTEQEHEEEKISHEHFFALLTDEQTNVHHLGLDTNSFGEFLFVTMSRPIAEGRTYLTFWGAGLHESRERWITDEWRWYETQQFLHTMPQKIAPEDAQALVQTRLDEIAPFVSTAIQSNRGKLYEQLARLTDEDNALSELEDLEDLGYVDNEDE
jgi:hypothetical protein